MGEGKSNTKTTSVDNFSHLWITHNPTNPPTVITNQRKTPSPISNNPLRTVTRNLISKNLRVPSTGKPDDSPAAHPHCYLASVAPIGDALPDFCWGLRDSVRVVGYWVGDFSAAGGERDWFFGF